MLNFGCPETIAFGFYVAKEDGEWHNLQCIPLAMKIWT